jgi:hypothetical protein
VFARNDAANLEIVLLADWSEGVRKRWRRGGGGGRRSGEKLAVAGFEFAKEFSVSYRKVA